LFQPACTVKNTFLIIKTPIFDVNELQWHFKMKCPFSDALYNQLQSKKFAVPLVSVMLKPDYIKKKFFVKMFLYSQPNIFTKYLKKASPS
jgi:hypothetical protein